MYKVTVVPISPATPGVEMRFIELAFDRELQINMLDVRQLIEDSAASLREFWNGQYKFARDVSMEANVLYTPVRLTPIMIWPNGTIDLAIAGIGPGLTGALMPGVMFDTQVDYYVRVANPVYTSWRLTSGIMARVKWGEHDNPWALGHMDAITAYNMLTYKNHS